MKQLRALPLVLAALLQLAPVSRLLLPVVRLGNPGTAFIRLATVWMASLGATHALSGASGSTIVSAPTASGTVGKAFSYRVRTTPYATADVSWEALFLNGAVPAGLAPVPGTPYIQGTPTEPGVYDMVIYAWRYPLSQVPLFFNSSSSALLTITITGGDVAPSITVQPLDVTVTEGNPASFVVGASGTQLKYQWYFGSTPLVGQTSSNLTFTSATLAEAGGYTVTVANSLATVTSRVATLAVQPKVVLPEILTQPASLTVTEGDSVRFSVAANGTGPLEYQWYFGTNLLSGQSGTNLVLSQAGLTDAGAYVVVVKNPAGSVTSSPAVLTVNPKLIVVPPFVLSAPGVNGGQIEFQFPAVARAAYVVEGKSSVSTNFRWGVLTNIAAQTSDSTVTVTLPATAAAGIFRVRSVP
jgi:hypothetical protein